MISATYFKYILNFKRPSGTSRGILRTKETWFLILTQNSRQGVGECALFRGLSVDDRPDYEKKLQWLCQNINLGLDKLLEELIGFPSIQFGLEQAFLSLESQTKFELFPSEFTKGKGSIPINGLVWMGDKSFMKSQIEQKIDAGFSCLKMKIGAIDFDAEYELLSQIRKEFSVETIQLRVDANGAFRPEEALEKLKILSDLKIHSIEQPIRQGQWEIMASLCDKTPLPIALDEELIGICGLEEKQKLIQIVKPQYIILKPSLIGGFRAAERWIKIAERENIPHWITSALESNIGLNAIAQWAYTLSGTMHQGLGTGDLFDNNFESPLVLDGGALFYQPKKPWHFNLQR